LALTSDSLAFEIAVPPEVRAGDSVPVTLTLTNRGSAAREVYLTGRPIAFDILVRRKGSNAAVWRRLAGATIAMVLRVQVLQPGESMRFEDKWAQVGNDGRRVAPGDYVVTGELPTDNQSLRTAPAPVRITAR
jgi:hypothetical protein